MGEDRRKQGSRTLDVFIIITFFISVSIAIFAFSQLAMADTLTYGASREESDNIGKYQVKVTAKVYEFIGSKLIDQDRKNFVVLVYGNLSSGFSIVKAINSAILYKSTEVPGDGVLINIEKNTGKFNITPNY